jgi:SAM-dependent methyltransferase
MSMQESGGPGRRADAPSWHGHADGKRGGGAVPMVSARHASPVPSSWPAGGLERLDRCPACGDARRATLHEGLTDRTFRSAPGRWRLVRCGGCASAYLDPRPTRATVALAYRTYYTHAEEPESTAPAGLPARLRIALANGELNRRWGYSAEPAARAGFLVGRLAPGRAALVGRSIRHLPARPGGALLDVGCGAGGFIAQMRRLGWRAEGLEPDPAAAAVARAAGLTVTVSALEDLAPDAFAHRFDAVTLNHVIEHLHAPEDALRRVRPLLAPGGLLWVATPNLRALGHRRYGRDWVALDPPRHMVLFHRPSLEALLRRCGFTPLPTPRPAPDATVTFACSAAIRAGRPPLEGPMRRRRATRALAALANRIAVRDPARAEELVVVARPGAP